jgi:hypothetical protein
MNIFATSFNPVDSARVLPDKHIVKMPLETCQMLSIVCSDKWGHGYGTLPKADGNPYATEKGAFRNHPCTKWANETVANSRWLLAHGIALCEEYFNRYGKCHTCFKTLLAADEIIPYVRSSSLTIVLTHSLLTKCTLHLNHGRKITIFVSLIVNLNGYENYINC